MTRLLSACLILFGCAIPARGDLILSPDSFTGVFLLEQTNTFGISTPSKFVGQGNGPVQYHNAVTIAHFDLSGVTDPIVGLGIAGSIPNITSVIGFPLIGYTYIHLNVNLAGTFNAADPSSVYQAATTGMNLGTFSASNLNGVPPEPYLIDYGPNYGVTLGPEALSEVHNTNSLDLAFVSTGGGWVLPGVGGGTGAGTTLDDLTLTVSTAPVPEPSSALIFGVGLAGFLFALKVPAWARA